MERLNDIIKRETQRRQQDGNLRPAHNTLQATQGGASPNHRPLPEQTARLGQYSYATRSAQQPGKLNRAPMPMTRSAQEDLVSRASINGLSQARPAQGNRSSGERFTPPPEHSGWQQERRAPARHAEIDHPLHNAAPHVDAETEWSGDWEEDTAQIRYGDWESGMSEESVRPRITEDAQRRNHVSARIAQTYARNQRPMVTRELRMQADEEVERIMAPQTRDARLAPPPAAPHGGQPHRLTQPLNRSTSIARVDQHLPNASVPARPQGQREQPMQVIPAPYVPSATSCPICKGAGYLRADVPYGHPNFGKPIACECKEAERIAKRRLYLQGVSNLSELQDKSFENFNSNTSRSVYNAYHNALEYAEDPDGWLLFIGKVGCGKTHLAAAIANRLLAQGSLVLFSTVSDLLDHLRATFMPTSTEVYDQLFQKMREAALLVLDDLGAQQSSPWANEKLFQLLNYRYNSRIPTIITTNNVGLQGVEERIRSRMTDTSLVTRISFDDAVDYRLRNPRRE